MEKVIIMAADWNYIDKTETTIKSICNHNQGIKFYLLNSDVAAEWFHIMNLRLDSVNSIIKDIKIDNETISKYPVWPHINYTTYMRYYISDLIEEDYLIYMDSDIIVTDNIDYLFNLSLDGYGLAGVSYNIPTMKGKFNAGMIVINNKYWRENNMTHNLLEITSELKDTLVNGDEHVLNKVFENKWLNLSREYNYLIGHDGTHFNEQFEREELKGCLPKIVHYLTYDKPWNMYSKCRLRELWWYYYSLDWGQLLGTKRDYYNKISKTSLKTFILTASDNIEGIEELITTLPEVHFNIAARTTMSSKLASLRKYKNVSLFPIISDILINHLLEQSDFYLDINYYYEVDNIIDKALSYNKKIYTCKETSHRINIADFIFEKGKVGDLIMHIKNIYNF